MNPSLLPSSLVPLWATMQASLMITIAPFSVNLTAALCRCSSGALATRKALAARLCGVVGP